MCLEIRKILAYRTDFWLTFLGQILAQYFIAEALWTNVFETNNVKTMQGFTLDQLKFYYLVTPLLIKIISGENIGFISREIYEGSLNRYLVYPISFFQYKATTYLTHSMVYAIQTALIVIAWIFYHHLDFGAHLFLGFFIIFLAAITYGLLLTIMELVSFWTDNIWSLGVMLRFSVLFLGGAFIPLAFFPDSIKLILNYSPFPYMIYLPNQIIMNRVGWTEFLNGSCVLLCWILILSFFIQLIWKRGSLKYTGVGI